MLGLVCKTSVEQKAYNVFMAAKITIAISSLMLACGMLPGMVGSRIDTRRLDRSSPTTTEINIAKRKVILFIHNKNSEKARKRSATAVLCTTSSNQGTKVASVDACLFASQRFVWRSFHKIPVVQLFGLDRIFPFGPLLNRLKNSASFLEFK